MAMNQDQYEDSAFGLCPQADHMQGSVAGKVFSTNSTMLYFTSKINPDGNAS